MLTVFLGPTIRLRRRASDSANHDQCPKLLEDLEDRHCEGTLDIYLILDEKLISYSLHSSET